MKKTLLSLIIGMGVTTSAFADDLMQVYQQAMANDPQVNRAKAQRDASFEGISISRANLLPQISGYVAYTKSGGERTQNLGNQTFTLDSDTDTSSYGIDLSMSLYDHANWVGLDRAEKVAEQSDAQYAASIQELIVRVVTAYFDVLRARDNVTFVRAEKRAIERQLEQTRQRFEVGLTAITDVHEAQANFDNTVAQEIQAENQLEFALESLRVITGKYHDKLYALDTDNFSAEPPAPQNVDQWLDIAEEKNLTLLANRLAVDIAKEDISSARAGHLPTLGFVANAGKAKNETESEGVTEAGQPFVDAFETPYQDSYSATVQLSVPIFSGFRTSALADQARHLYVSASEDLEFSYRQTVQSVRSSYNDVRASISTIRALEQAVVSARSALQATEAGFDVGTRTIVDVLNSTRNLFDARRNLSDARYNFIQAVVNLKQAAGNLTESDLQMINKGLEPATEEAN